MVLHTPAATSVLLMRCLLVCARAPAQDLPATDDRSCWDLTHPELSCAVPAPAPALLSLTHEGPRPAPPGTVRRLKAGEAGTGLGPTR